MKQLDMTGHPCPIPVVQTKKLLAQPDTCAVEVTVDNLVAVQNLEKMAKGLGYGFSWQQADERTYMVEVAKLAGPDGVAAKVPSAPDGAPAPPVPKPADEGPTVLVTAGSLGGGSEELGKILMKGFIFSLTELDPAPKAVIFLNGGAHLTTEGANTVPDLQALAAKGTEVLTCGTCANYFDLTDKLAVGALTDMMGITGRLAAAARLITL